MEIPKTHRMRRRLIVPLLALLSLAACGSSSTGSSQSGARTTPASPATAPSTASTQTATAPAGSTTATSGAPSRPRRCIASELSLSYLGGQGATGHGELGFALRNTGARTCVAFGYPGVLFLNRAGGALPTIPKHTTQDFFGSLPNHPLALGPGNQVSFRLGVTHGAASTAGCTTAYGLQVIPPNDTATLRTQIPHGAYECQVTTVSPLQPGTAALS